MRWALKSLGSVSGGWSWRRLGSHTSGVRFVRGSNLRAGHCVGFYIHILLLQLEFKVHLFESQVRRRERDPSSNLCAILVNTETFCVLWAICCCCRKGVMTLAERVEG